MQIDRHTNRQTDKQTDRDAHIIDKQLCIYISIGKTTETERGGWEKKKREREEGRNTPQQLTIILSDLFSNKRI